MKKLLIATTALVATAGIAAAEVKVGGDGRMGVVFNGKDLNFSSRVRVSFTLSGETDGGLSFGGSFRADNAGGAANGSNGSIFISGAFGKLEMGDVTSAAEAIIGDLPGVGFTGLGDLNDVGYITGDSNLLTANNPLALYTYTTGGLTFALSFNDGKLSNTSAKDTQDVSIGLGYSFGDYSVGLGYENSKPVGAKASTHLILGGEATFGTTSVKAIVGQGSGAMKGYEQFGLGVTSTFDAVTVKAFYHQERVKAGSNANLIGTSVTGPIAAGKTDYYGIGAAYSLGGGASVEGGIAKQTGTKTVADLGLKFTF